MWHYELSLCMMFLVQLVANCCPFELILQALQSLVRQLVLGCVHVTQVDLAVRCHLLLFEQDLQREVRRSVLRSSCMLMKRRMMCEYCIPKSPSVGPTPLKAPC